MLTVPRKHEPSTAECVGSGGLSNNDDAGVILDGAEVASVRRQRTYEQLVTGLRSKRLSLFQEVLVLRPETPPNPPHPPEIVRDRHVLPAISEVRVQPLGRGPAKLITLELQLLLYATLLEPVVAEDDHVRVERAFEELAERGEQP